MNLLNLPFIEEVYSSYLKEPMSVDPSWRYFFDGFDFAGLNQSSEKNDGSFRLLSLIDAYRRFGHTQSQAKGSLEPFAKTKELDPENHGFFKQELTQEFPTFGFCGKPRASLQEIIDALTSIYCSRIGFEYMHLDQDKIRWIQRQIEPLLSISLSGQDKLSLFKKLTQAQLFESFLHTKYPGQTRFSLEGLDSLIGILADIIVSSQKAGMEGFFIGMAHRGRLNVLTHILQMPYETLFQEFEGTQTYTSGQSGDVVYHKGFSSAVKINEQSFHLHLAPNSSSLESVDGIVLGQTKACQIANGDREKKRFGAIILHGDAALSGQGVIYETLQMSQVEGFSTGGTIHIATNNQIGYTTLPQEGRSTPYCTDIAKAFSLPVFHVNADDPEACVFAARLALSFRLQFGLDVFIDLIGFRKYGHNEGDEPLFTQPVQYKNIKNRKPVKEIYLDQLLQEDPEIKAKTILFEEEVQKALVSSFEKAKQNNSASQEIPIQEAIAIPQMEKSELQKIARSLINIPPSFRIHPKLEKLMKDRVSQLEKDPQIRSIDWGNGESLAFGSLLQKGLSIRLSGQDVKRGTFSHRHAEIFDQEKGDPYRLYSCFSGRFDVYNTILSEYGALSFEIGYSWQNSQDLVIWEAQYGDFDNGAQIPIDHYIVSSQQKWLQTSSIVLLLPHAYEGAGPEHSSARPERFLQLCANENIQVVYPTTPAQIFHLLRRQAFSSCKKPLIVLSPKSLLRNPNCLSSLEELTEGAFQKFIDDADALTSCKRLIFCSGKIYYDLLSIRDQILDAALIRIEQIYPFCSEDFKNIISKYTQVQSCFYVQEEPENMGAWEFVKPYLIENLPKNMTIEYIGRPRSAATATGSKKQHVKEQTLILNAVKGIQ